MTEQDNKTPVTPMEVFGLGEDVRPNASAQTATLPEPSSRPGRKFNIIRGNLMLAGLFIGGLAGVYLLSLRGGPAQASAEQAKTELQVDAAVTNLKSIGNAESRRKAREIIASFQRDASERQIPLSAIKEDPFLARSGESSTAGTGAKTPTPEVVPVDQRDAERAVKGLRLQSVMASGKGLSAAMINNNLVALGQTVNGWTVVEIRPQRVVLRWGELTHELVLED